MTDAFAKYTEILNLNRGDFVETTRSVVACHTPEKNGWKKNWISTGIRLRVMSVREDALTAIVPSEAGYEYVTVFCDQWGLLSVVGGEGGAR